MRILVMRARADGEEIAERLAATGHEAMLAPVIEIVPKGSPGPTGPFDATIATSVHGLATIEAMSRAPRDKPFFAVGNRTRAAAASAGFIDLRCGSDASALAGLIAAALDRRARVLYLAGRDRKPVLEAALAEAGLSVTVHETYDALGTAAWADPVIGALRAGQVEAALHFSRRSATLALELAQRHHILPAFLDLQHFCLSDDVGEPLLRSGAHRIAISPRPDAESLLALVTAGPVTSADRHESAAR